MNVTASKMLLGVSLAAYAYCSWDHLFAPDRTTAPPAKGRELTAATVNRAVKLELTNDPFGAEPLDRPAAAGASLPHEPGREIGELNLQGIMVSPLGRTALINGNPIREGEVISLGEGRATIRARRIGLDFVIVEGGGQVVMLRLANAPGGGAATAQADAPMASVRTER